jgi:hypothetical protein
MCAPLVVGIITGLTSVVGSIASYSQQQQEVAYQNSVNQQRYQAEVQAYERSVVATKEQYRLNAESANRAYVSEQNKLRAEYQKAITEQQTLLTSSLQAQGTVLASGRTGQSVGLLMSDAERQYGRDLATLGVNLAWTENDFFNNTQAIFNEAQSQNNVVASNQMLKPSAPIPVPGPSALGLVTGIAQGGLSGFQAYSSLKAPSSGGGGGSSSGGGSWSGGGIGSSQYQPGTPSIYTPKYTPPSGSYWGSPVPRASTVR